MTERRALPGWAIDLIRDGVPRADLRGNGDLAVWRALGRTALAAVNAGWSRPAWETEVLRRRSNLGTQATVAPNGTDRTPRAVAKILNAAWDRARERADATPQWATDDDRRAEVTARVATLRNRAADPDSDLTDAARRVLACMADAADDRMSTRVTMPRRAIATTTGLSEKATRTAIEALVNSGAIERIERGRPTAPNARGTARAAVYQLPPAPPPSSRSEDMTSGPHALTSGPHADKDFGPPALTSGPDHADTGDNHHNPTLEEEDIVNIATTMQVDLSRLDLSDPDHIDLLQRIVDFHRRLVERDLPSNVTPIRARDT